MNSYRPGKVCRQWLSIALAVVLAVSALTILVLIPRGETVAEAFRATAPAHALTLLEPTDADSWRPVIAASEAHGHGKPIYSVFFDEGIKFQYPPTALLLLDLLPVADSARFSTLEWASRIAVILSVLFAILILLRSIEQISPASYANDFEKLPLIILGLCLGLAYYPMLKAHSLGQVQVFLNAMMVIALYACLRGSSALAGGLMGLCCLLKPQYCLLFVWGALRRDWRFSLAFAAIAGMGLLVSLAKFGFANHLEYLQVLSEISRHGEAFWANQSINGLMQRAVGNGDPVRFDPDGFPEYHLVVHAMTLVTSAAILLVALWPGRQRRTPTESAIALAVMLAAVTLSSPVAWEHHYGSLLATFALAVPMLAVNRPLGAFTGPVALAAYVAMSSIVLRPSIFFVEKPWLWPAAWHLLFGTMLWLACLLVLRSNNSWSEK